MKKNNLMFFSIFFLTIFLLFFRLGSTTLTNWDEAWLASVAQDIAQRNDWLTGRFNGQTWFYEPPFLTWVLALIYKIAGPNGFWLRFPNAVCGFLTVVVVYKLSILITKSRTSAFISCLILLCDIEFLFRSRQINVEIPLTLALTGCIFTLYSAKAINKLVWFYFSAFLYGVSFLIKRASPILALSAILVLSWQYLKIHKKIRPLVIGLIIFIAISAPWFVYQYLQWKNQFIDEFFLGYTIGKIKTANQTIGTSMFFYFSALRHAFKIWSLLIPPALIWIVVQIRKNNKQMLLPLIIYSLTFFIALSLVPIKSSWYLLPIHPVIALFIGIFLDKILPKSINKLALFGILGIFAFGTIKYRASYIVPDTTGHQVKISSYVKNLTVPEDNIYLDDDYLPVAVFYSQRKVAAIRFDRIQTNPVIDDISPGKYILTNRQTINQLQSKLSRPLSEIYRVYDLILVQVKTN